MRGSITVQIADDNSLIIRLQAETGAQKIVTCAPKDYVGLHALVETQIKHFQKQPVVDLTEG